MNSLGKEIKGGNHWKLIKKHQSFVKAMKFHEKYVNGLTFADAIGTD